jgi:acyl-[acyl-carrier-protein]-phospholipid O-acyltransferase/long-chain-fatty-acid--[acyl-carrier-protein] ligase
MALHLLPVSWIERLAGGGKQTPDDLCTIMFSSGSTGTPKGVMLSHHNIIVQPGGDRADPVDPADDRMMGVLPFFHSFGFTGTLCLPCCAAWAPIYHPNPLDAKTIGKLAREHERDHPHLHADLLPGYYRTCAPEDFKTLRHVVVGAERLRPDFAAQFKEKFGIDMLEGYGATEMGRWSPSTCRTSCTGRGARSDTSRHVGHPLPGVARQGGRSGERRGTGEGEEGCCC